MNIKDVKEWFMIAEKDFESANVLNNTFRKHNELICYLCSQAVEKYLKGYLIYNGIIPERTHNLHHLNTICIGIDKVFETIKKECGFLNKFANDIRYPHEYETTETDINFSIKTVEKIRNLEPILELRNIISNENK